MKLVLFCMGNEFAGWKRNMEMQKAATAVYQVAPVIEQGMMR